tara:strand:+ start:932 stop:1966 length:1035 start_codon:yes stop_codon:yes gene_type:complete
MTSGVNKTGYRFLGQEVEGLDLPAFQVGIKWRGGDLQTMRNTIMGSVCRLEDEAERVFFDIGAPGRLSGALHRKDAREHLPLVVIIHGLTGDEGSPNVISAASSLLEQGYPVLRLNLRGAGPSVRTSQGSYHAGMTEDLAQVISQLHSRAYGAGIVLYGISLGGNMMLKYLGEQGADANILAAIGVSTPLDLKAVQGRLMDARNAMYHNYLLLGMKKYAKRLTGRVAALHLEKAQAAASILEYDDQYVAPSHGMAGAEDYYRLQSSGVYLDKIRVPTLLIHAENDPWVPVESYYDHDWSGNDRLHVIVCNDGGHVGFHGKDSKVPWHERAMARYLDHILDLSQV